MSMSSQRRYRKDIAGVVSLKRLKNRTTRVIPALPWNGRNPEATYGGFRVKHGMTCCIVVTGMLH